VLKLFSLLPPVFRVGTRSYKRSDGEGVFLDICSFVCARFWKLSRTFPEPFLIIHQYLHDRLFFPYSVGCNSVVTSRDTLPKLLLSFQSRLEGYPPILYVFLMLLFHHFFFFFISKACPQTPPTTCSAHSKGTRSTACTGLPKLLLPSLRFPLPGLPPP